MGEKKLEEMGGTKIILPKGGFSREEKEKYLKDKGWRPVYEGNELIGWRRPRWWGGPGPVFLYGFEDAVREQKKIDEMLFR